MNAYNICNPDANMFRVPNKWISNYNHWTVDIFLDYLLVVDRKLLRSEQRVVWPDDIRQFPFCHQLLELGGLDISKLITVPQKLDTVVFTHAMYVQRSEKYQGQALPWHITLLRRHILPNALARTEHIPSSKVLIINRRNKRFYLHIDKLIQKLSDKGMKPKVIYPEDYTVAEQLAWCSRASIIIGIHGTGLTNLYSIKPNTNVYELATASYPQTVYRDITKLCGARYYRLIDDSHKDPTIPIAEHDIDLDPEYIANLIASYKTPAFA